MRVGGLVNIKGGVGKTTLGRTIAAGAANMGFRVLLIDADPQGHTTISWGYNRENAFYNFAVDGVAKIYDVPQERWQDPAIDPMDGVLYLMPGSQFSSQIPAQQPDPLAVLKHLAPLRDALDFVFFDTNPTPSDLHPYVFLALDDVAMPLKLEFFDMEGVGDTLAALDGYNETRRDYGFNDIFARAVIPNMTRLNTALNSMYMAQVTEYFGGRRLSPIAERSAWGEANHLNVSIFQHASGTSAAKDGWRMVREYFAIQPETAEEVAK